MLIYISIHAFYYCYFRRRIYQVPGTASKVENGRPTIIHVFSLRGGEAALPGAQGHTTTQGATNNIMRQGLFRRVLSFIALTTTSNYKNAICLRNN